MDIALWGLFGDRVAWSWKDIIDKGHGQKVFNIGKAI
jgi:hypothetical protein